MNPANHQGGRDYPSERKIAEVRHFDVDPVLGRKKARRRTARMLHYRPLLKAGGSSRPPCRYRLFYRILVLFFPVKRRRNIELFPEQIAPQAPEETALRTPSFVFVQGTLKIVGIPGVPTARTAGHILFSRHGMYAFAVASSSTIFALTSVRIFTRQSKQKLLSP